MINNTPAYVNNLQRRRVRAPQNCKSSYMQYYDVEVDDFVDDFDFDDFVVVDVVVVVMMMMMNVV